MLQLRQGLNAYAAYQADIYIQLCYKFAKKWLPFLYSQSIIPDWASEFTDIVNDISLVLAADTSSTESDDNL